MINEFLKKLNEQSEDVFGVGARKTLSVYSVFAVGSVVIPVISIIFILLFKVL